MDHEKKFWTDRHKNELYLLNQKLKNKKYTSSEYGNLLYKIREIQYRILFNDLNIPCFRKKDSKWIYKK